MQESPEFLYVFRTLLDLAEPSGTLADSLVFKAAQVESMIPTNAHSVEADDEDSDIVFKANEWPCSNHRSYKLDPTITLTPVLTVEEKSNADPKAKPFQISAKDLAAYGGLWLNLDECGDCHKTGATFFCACHQIATCEACHHSQSRANELFAVWKIDDRGEQVCGRIRNTSQPLRCGN